MSVSSETPHHDPRLVPLLLAAAGLVALVVATEGDAWPLALLWAGAALLFAWLWSSLAGRLARAALGVGAAATLVALTWEGGLFLLPAIVAALAVTVLGRG